MRRNTTRRLLSVAILILGVVIYAYAQQTYPVNSNGGNIIATNAACVPNACVGITASGASTITVVVTGTFVATLAVEQSADGTTFTSAGTITAAGTTSYSAANVVLFRVRASAYTSGNAGVNITTSSGGGGGANGVPITPTTVNVTNSPGVFNTTSTLSTYSSPNIFGTGTPPSGTMSQCTANIQNWYGALGSPFTDTDAFDACIFVPSSNVTNGASVAMQGLAYNGGNLNTGQFGATIAVGAGAFAFCNAGNANLFTRCFGISGGATSLAGNGGDFLAGTEMDINANNNADQGFGYLASMRGSGTATANNMKAFWVQQAGGATNQWTSGFFCDNASVSVAAGAVCLSLGKQTTAASSGSQAINWTANDGSADFTVGLALVGSTAHYLQTSATFKATQYVTLGTCAVNSVSPAACGANPNGAFVVPTTTTTYTVNTTMVTANSVILITPRTYTGNLPSSPTCVAPAVTSAYVVSAIVAATSFTITLPSTTGQTCWNYYIMN